MIYGIGIDLVEIKRIKKILDRKESNFLNKILTEKEIAQYSRLKNIRKIEYVAGRFAGKEAIAKALKVGIGNRLCWKDVEILNSAEGVPYIEVKKNFFNNCELVFHISISHTKELAIAKVISEQI